jgi:hypothetical protein
MNDDGTDDHETMCDSLMDTSKNLWRRREVASRVVV